MTVSKRILIKMCFYYRRSPVLSSLDRAEKWHVSLLTERQKKKKLIY